jgi:UDP-3-O-[3-hydroxymyristoyl] glucosamine N-acyltransferase
MKLSDLNNVIEEKVEVVRDGEFETVMLSGLRFDKELKTISYILSMNYFPAVRDAGVSCIICPEAIAKDIKDEFDGGICTSNDPKTVFFQVHEAISKQREDITKTVIGDNCNIAESAVISPKNVRIGNNVTIDPQVVIYDGVVIDDNVRIMSGTVIGCPAFYYYGDGAKKKLVYSSGTVHLYEGSTIHTNVTIQKGVIGGETKIGRYSSIDNCIMVGHDVWIGENVIAAANITFGGWAEVGDNTFVGVQACIAPMATVGRNCKISMGAVVTKDVPDNSQVSGNFAIDHKLYVEHLKSILNTK